jgi:two-component system, LytTR family, response regulator
MQSWSCSQAGPAEPFSGSACRGRGRLQAMAAKFTPWSVGMAPKLRVVIVDDEPLARENIRLALRHEPDVEVVAECEDGEEALEVIRREEPDLLFLDVQMPGLDGFGVIDRLGIEHTPAVVFVTAYEEHALRAFKVHAVDYVLKPFDDERFQDAFHHAKARLSVERQQEVGARLTALLAEFGMGDAVAGPPAEPPPAAYSQWLTVSTGERSHFIRVEDVDWLEADGNYVRVHVGQRSSLMRLSLTRLAQRLDPAKFVRIHRSTIVNLSRIREVQRWTGGDCIALLHDGRLLRVSRKYRAALLKPVR